MKKIFWSLFGVLLGILVLHLWQRVEVRITFDLPECKSEEDKITGCVAKEYYESGEVFREVPLKNANCILRVSIKTYQQDGSCSVYRVNQAECYTKTYTGKWVTGAEEKRLRSDYERYVYGMELSQNKTVSFKFEYCDYYLKVR